jgi:hypothetical protein
MSNIPIPGTLVPSVVGGKVVHADNVDGTIPSSIDVVLGDGSTVAADVNARMVGVDAIPLLGDNTHYSANDRIRVGMLLGAAAIGV